MNPSSLNKIKMNLRPRLSSVLDYLTMDFTQTKLSRTEWNSTEIPISKSEHDILSMLINAAGGDINVRVNHTQSIVSFLKIAKTEKSAMDKINAYIYSTFLAPACRPIELSLKEKGKEKEKNEKNKEKDKDEKNEKVHLNSADRIRMEKVTKDSLQSMFEFVLLEHMLPLVPLPFTNESISIASTRIHFHAFTLMNLLTASVQYVNPMLTQLATQLVLVWTPHLSKHVIVQNAVEFIERNKQLFLYEDLRLYDHQKKLFVLCRSDTPKLIFNIAPTGTGKTMTAIALTEIVSEITGRKKKVLFMCSARHVGLALTRSAISVGKKVAMAFGCESADDIRLHYLAAKEYTVNKRSGRIAKVDNSIGDNVEIMVCDTKSFCVAQQYMLAFFDAEELILYWDEPTIFMDYLCHEMHGIIHHNWCENRIPIVVLSSATLPKPEELTEVTADFKNRFTASADSVDVLAEIHSIVTNDCRKSIPIIDTDGFAVVPHRLCGSAENARVMCAHCENTPTLLRYFDLHEIVAFIGLTNIEPMELDRHFDTLLDITMHSVKMFYLAKLASLSDNEFNRVTTILRRIQLPRILKNERGELSEKSKSIDSSLATASLARPGMPLIRTETVASSTTNKPTVGTSGVLVTTKDAYTLTDGPSIFITDDVDKIAAFYVQQARIPSIVMQDLMHKIAINNEINKRMNVLELELESMDKQIQSKCANALSGRNKSSKDNSSRIYNRTDGKDDDSSKNVSSKLTESINALRSTLKSVELNDSFIPNRLMHLNKWAPESHLIHNAFTSNIDESTVTEIMGIHGIDDMWKILLMMGIGVLSVSVNKTYTEIMKRLSDAQKLILIIATSDYIYGMNYAYCHGFMSKDLDLTQEKLIQAMGRIGRDNVQQNFTIRFRDNAQIARIFTADACKPEILNMNRLLSS